MTGKNMEEAPAGEQIAISGAVKAFEDNLLSEHMNLFLKERNLVLAQRLSDAATKLGEMQTALEAAGLKIAELQQQLDGKTGKKPN